MKNSEFWCFICGQLFEVEGDVSDTLLAQLDHQKCHREEEKPFDDEEA